MRDSESEGLALQGARLSRRRFLSAGGTLIVGLTVLPSYAKQPDPSASSAALANTPDPTRWTSWLEIHADNTILIRTGKCDFGMSSIYTAYPQIVAEELGVPFESITGVVGGDTDRTPDGGGTFGLLRTNVLNLRKAAAYTREAILDLAAERFGVARDQLYVKDGVVYGGSGSPENATFGELVQGQELELSIPVSGELTSLRGLVVEGDPPLKPVSEYGIVGRSFKNPATERKVTANEVWVSNVKLPGMLHARVVHPKTLGSRLVAVGKVDKNRFPNAQVVVIGNLVGVVAPDEWDAVQASRQVAASTEWTDWKGLPGHEQIFDHLRTDADWEAIDAAVGSKNQGDVDAGLSTAARILKASYQRPYNKHAPIGPNVALADYRPDGSVTIHAHSQNPQNLRGHIAKMLDTSIEKVVVREYSGAGHYGRSNGGNAGGEDAAVLFSKELGRPVRVQWMRAEDLQWSTQSAASVSDIEIGLDENGRMTAYRADHYMPAMQDDRLIGALLAGLPTIDAPSPKPTPGQINSIGNRVRDDWLYTKVANLEEHGHGTWQVGERESPLAVGLRNHSMRTPVQFQQNFPRELAITEAAALTGADPLQFRIDHATDDRLKDILQRARDVSSWQRRPAPLPSSADKNVLRGQGVAAMFRGNAYWACTSQISVTPATGHVAVEKITLVVDPGIVVNPLQLKRQVEAGCLMGVSQALYEEVTFDEGAVTISDWISYPILKMADMPDVEVVLVSRPEAEIYGQGSEGANAMVPAAIASAVFDATGKPPRRLPLRPAYVKELLIS